MESILHMSRGPSDPAVRNDKPTVKFFFQYSRQNNFCSLKAKMRSTRFACSYVNKISGCG